MILFFRKINHVSSDHLTLFDRALIPYQYPGYYYYHYYHNCHYYYYLLSLFFRNYRYYPFLFRINFHHHFHLRKIDRLLDVLELTEGDQVLEVGCGWGSLAIRNLGHLPLVPCGGVRWINGDPDWSIFRIRDGKKLNPIVSQVSLGGGKGNSHDIFWMEFSLYRKVGKMFFHVDLGIYFN